MESYEPGKACAGGDLRRGAVSRAVLWENVGVGVGSRELSVLGPSWTLVLDTARKVMSQGEEAV